MKEIYYTYNNEAIASCIFLSLLDKIDSIDFARSCLILPFLLDDRTVNYLLQDDIELDLEQIIKKESRLFVSFNKRYLSLLPVSINSLMILKKGNRIYIEKDIFFRHNSKIEFDMMGERFKKIEAILPKFLTIIRKYSTAELYKILKIQL